eukprot:SAG22_NODE_4942_length_1124_cov_5.812683_1_plen_224_part_10
MEAWAKEEDEVLLTAVRLYGVKAWSIVACALRGRTGKQCRERYQHQLLHSQPRCPSPSLLATERRYAAAAPSAHHQHHLQQQQYHHHHHFRKQQQQQQQQHYPATASKRRVYHQGLHVLVEADRTDAPGSSGGTGSGFGSLSFGCGVDTPRKRGRYVADDFDFRTPWSAPPRACCALPATPAGPEELTTVGLPRVDISDDSEVELVSGGGGGGGGGGGCGGGGG